MLDNLNNTTTAARGLRLGVAGPVGTGKSTLIATICRELASEYEIAVVTNDIYTIEDAKILAAQGVLPVDRIVGLETGGCPHTAIRDDVTPNLIAVEDLERQFHPLDMVIVESGGDNLTATFSPALVDAQIFCIDVAQGEKIPRKAGQGMIKSDLFVINKTDLAPHVGADLAVMEADSKVFRGDKPFCFTNLKTDEGLEQVIEWIHHDVLMTDLES